LAIRDFILAAKEPTMRIEKIEAIIKPSRLGEVKEALPVSACSG
jgi:hypothetical protein